MRGIEHELKKLIMSMLQVLHYSELDTHNITPDALKGFTQIKDTYLFDGCVGLLLNLQNLIIPSERLMAIINKQRETVNDTYYQKSQGYPNIYSQLEASSGEKDDDNEDSMTHKRHLSSSEEVVVADEKAYDNFTPHSHENKRYHFGDKDLQRVSLMHENIKLRFDILNNMNISDSDKNQHKENLYNEACCLFRKLNN